MRRDKDHRMVRCAPAQSTGTRVKNSVSRHTIDNLTVKKISPIPALQIFVSIVLNIELPRQLTMFGP
jgi:hypothetical protein